MPRSKVKVKAHTFAHIIWFRENQDLVFSPSAFEDDRNLLCFAFDVCNVTLSLMACLISLKYAIRNTIMIHWYFSSRLLQLCIMSGLGYQWIFEFVIGRRDETAFVVGAVCYSWRVNRTVCMMPNIHFRRTRKHKRLFVAISRPMTDRAQETRDLKQTWSYGITKKCIGDVVVYTFA